MRGVLAELINLLNFFVLQVSIHLMRNIVKFCMLDSSIDEAIIPLFFYVSWAHNLLVKHFAEDGERIYYSM